MNSNNKKIKTGYAHLALQDCSNEQQDKGKLSYSSLGRSCKSCLSCFIFLFAFFCLCASCQRISTTIEPCIERPIHPQELQREHRKGCIQIHPSPFSPLTEEEKRADWGKEYEIGVIFGQDFDLYRAITSFKRASILLGDKDRERQMEIEYFITLCYYLGNKFVEVVYRLESGAFAYIDESFVGYEDLLLMLYDSYDQLGECEKAAAILEQMEMRGSPLVDKLVFFSEIETGNLTALRARSTYVSNLMDCYCRQSKSVKKAQALNVFLPGAGYWYVGQRQTAVTAFLVNALFIGATAHFFLHDNIAAGVVCLSIESGWYFGGITGVGLAARSYNARLYEGYAAKICDKEKLFPLVMLNYKF